MPTTARPRFDELFANPRHYRGDCKLLRTAIRRGWLDDLAPDARDALFARLLKATSERDSCEYLSDDQRARGGLAMARAIIDAEQRALAEAKHFTRFAWPSPTHPTGRPRDRYQVSEHKHRIEASVLRRQYVRSGGNPDEVTAIDATIGEHLVRLRVTRPSTAAGFSARWLLVCPSCGVARSHLYSTKGGIGCRGCLVLRY